MTLNRLLLLQFCPQVPCLSLCLVLFMILLHWIFCKVLIYKMHCRVPTMQQQWAQCQLEQKVPNQNNQPPKSEFTMLYCVCTRGMKSISGIYTIYTNVAHSSQRKILRRGRVNWCFCANPQKHFPTITGFIHSTRRYWHIYPPHHLWLSSLIQCEV